MEVSLISWHLAGLGVVALGAAERCGSVEDRLHIGQCCLIEPGESLALGDDLVTLITDIEVMVDRSAGNGKDAIHKEVHRIRHTLEAAFVVDVAHLEEHGRHHLPEQAEIGVVGELAHLLQEHLREQLVETQHQGVALEVGLDRPIGVGLVGVALQVVVEAAAHALVPEHRLHAGLGELHVHPVVPEVMQQLGHGAGFAAGHELKQLRMGLLGATPDAQLRLITGVTIGPIQVLLRDEVLESRQRIQEYTLGDIEQIAPVEIHRHGIGLVDADDLLEVLL